MPQNVARGAPSARSSFPGELGGPDFRARGRCRTACIAGSCCQPVVHAARTAIQNAGSGTWQPHAACIAGCSDPRPTRRRLVAAAAGTRAKKTITKSARRACVDALELLQWPNHGLRWQLMNRFIHRRKPIFTI